MTRVDFHFNAPDRLQDGCRLVRKGHRSGARILVWCEDPVALAQFDQMLWTFSDADFIPHVVASNLLAPETPVLLTAEAIETSHHEVLVNLGRQTPPMFSRFDRLIEVVSGDDEDRSLARDRWRFYKDRGYPLNAHDLARAA